MMWDSWDVTTYTGLNLDEEEADRIYMMSPEELLREANDLQVRPRKKRVASIAFLHYARRCMEIERWHYVEDALKTATTLDSKNGAAWFHRGMVLMREHAYHNASRAFKKVCKLQPQVIDHWAEAGAAYYHLKQWDDSREALEQALVIKRTPRVLQFLGLTLFELGQENEGLTLLQEAYTLAPDDRGILFTLGIILFRLDKTPEALPLLQQSVDQPKKQNKTEKRRVRDALDIGRSDFGSWLVLADVFERLDRRWETIMIFEMATRVMPKNAQAWYELSQVHTDYDLYEDAVHQAYELDKTDPDILCEQGQLFFDAGLKKYALDMYLEAVACDPKHEFALGRIDEIEEEFEELERYGHAPYLGEYGYNAAYDDYYD